MPTRSVVWFFTAKLQVPAQNAELRGTSRRMPPECPSSGLLSTRVGIVPQVPEFLEVTVAGDNFLDLTDVDVRKHAGVLLDGIGDTEVLKSNREVLQGRAKLCKAGRSPTMSFSSQYSLHRRAVVATFDLSATSLHMLDSDHWLSNPRSVICL